MEKQTVSKQITEVLSNLKEYVAIPIGISNKHIHLTAADFEKLFPGQQLTVKKMLNQPGEFASEQTVTVVGPKGTLTNVRILGPFRKQSQVELALTDARKIGISVPVRLSGDIKGTPSITLKSENGQITLPEGAIAAKRHIHISTADAKVLNVKAGQRVCVSIQSAQRSLVFDDCIIRVGETFKLEMHIDTDEANAVGATPKSIGKIVCHK